MNEGRYVCVGERVRMYAFVWHMLICMYTIIVHNYELYVHGTV